MQRAVDQAQQLQRGDRQDETPSGGCARGDAEERGARPLAGGEVADPVAKAFLAGRCPYTRTAALDALESGREEVVELRESERSFGRGHRAGVGVRQGLHADQGKPGPRYNLQSAARCVGRTATGSEARRSAHRAAGSMAGPAVHLSNMRRYTRIQATRSVRKVRALRQVGAVTRKSQKLKLGTAAV